MILVTGATGQLGRLVIQQLLARVPADQIVAGARDLSKAADLGVVARLLDYDRPETVTAALEGVDRVLLISSSEGIGTRAAQHQVVIDAAKAAGVSLLAYTSILRAPSATQILARDHQATEAALVASGVPYALLRNGWYIENYFGSVGPAVQYGTLLGAAGAGRLSPAARADFAEAAAIVLTRPDQAGAVYELAGDEAISLADLAARLAKLSGKSVAYQDLPIADYAKALTGFGVPAGFADVLADADRAIAAGELEDHGGALSTLLGRPTRPVDAVLAQALPA